MKIAFIILLGKGNSSNCDTTYIHRGKIIEEGERYAVTQYFIT